MPATFPVYVDPFYATQTPVEHSMEEAPAFWITECLVPGGGGALKVEGRPNRIVIPLTRARMRGSTQACAILLLGLGTFRHL